MPAAISDKLVKLLLHFYRVIHVRTTSFPRPNFTSFLLLDPPTIDLKKKHSNFIIPRVRCSLKWKKITWAHLNDIKILQRINLKGRMVAAVSKAVVENNLPGWYRDYDVAKETEAKSCTVFVELLTFDRIGKGEENSFDSHCFGGGKEGR